MGEGGRAEKKRRTGFYFGPAMGFALVLFFLRREGGDATAVRLAL